tara:strand:+ start:746 stop:1480 length:735 start_codon:yes stop_codon:yes gene_type:complete
MGVKCKTLIYTPINAISFRILGGTKIITPHFDINNNITALETEKGIFLTLGDTIKVKGLKYIANEIFKIQIKEIIHYDVKMCTRTKTSTFIVPLLGGSRKLFLWNSYFVNAHLNKDLTLTLVYRLLNDPLLNRFRNTLESFEIFVKKLKIDNQYIAYTLKIRSKYKKLLKLFINGKYSSFPNQYKLKILEFHGKDTDDIVAQVLFKSKKRRAYLEELFGCKIDKSIDLLSLPKNEEFNSKIYKR